MNNPVMVKELRGRMRGVRAFGVLSVFLLFLSCFALLVYMVASATIGSVSAGISVGKIVFSALYLFELFLVSFLTPAFTAGSFSGERERRTYDLLFSTTLSARQVVWGKLVSALAYIMILVVASAPLLGTAFFMGGVAPEEIAIGIWTLLLTAVMFGSIGIFFSSIFNSTIASTALTYAVVLTMTVGLPIVSIVILPVIGRMIDPGLLESLALIYFAGVALCTNPFLAAGVTEGLYTTGRSLFFFTEAIGSHNVFLISPWLVFSVIYLLGSTAFSLAAVRIVGRTR